MVAPLMLMMSLLSLTGSATVLPSYCTLKRLVRTSLPRASRNTNNSTFKTCPVLSIPTIYVMGLCLPMVFWIKAYPSICAPVSPM